MKTMSALEMMSHLPPPTPESLVAQPQGLLKGAFALMCATEALEAVVTPRYRNLADALYWSAHNLYQETRAADEGGTSMLLPFSQNNLALRLQEFEGVFLCISEFLSDEGNAASAMTKQRWTQVAAAHQSVKQVLIKKLQTMQH